MSITICLAVAVVDTTESVLSCLPHVLQLEQEMTTFSVAPTLVPSFVPVLFTTVVFVDIFTCLVVVVVVVLVLLRSTSSPDEKFFVLI